MTNDAPGLLVDQARKRYGNVLALDGVSLSLEAGRWLALVGESGAGKSTLVRCINRLEELDSGRIVVGGVDVRERDPIALRRATGYVPQEGGLLPHWHVLRNVALVPRLVHLADEESRAREALGMVGLGELGLEQRWPHELSGGQRQRVALARALAADQRLLLLDEPFGALDAITRSDLQRTVMQLRQTRALTAVLVTHDIREALLLADLVGVMRDGRLEQLAPPSELHASPATAYVSRLLERAELAP